MEAQKDKPTDVWSTELAGGTLTFISEAVGSPIVAYVYTAKFQGGTSSYSMMRQSREALTRSEIESRFADVLSEIRHGQ